MNIRFNIRDMERINSFLEKLPRGTIRSALGAMADYFIGNDQRGLSHAPPRKKHGPGNPYKWQTVKQRNAFFASNGFGRGIPSVRTNQGVKGWKQQVTKNGYQIRLFNIHEYMDYVQGFLQQRGHWADGWRKYRDIILSNMNGAMQAANRAVEKWLRDNEK